MIKKILELHRLKLINNKKKIKVMRALLFKYNKKIKYDPKILYLPSRNLDYHILLIIIRYLGHQGKNIMIEFTKKQEKSIRNEITKKYGTEINKLKKYKKGSRFHDQLNKSISQYRHGLKKLIINDMLISNVNNIMKKFKKDKKININLKTKNRLQLSKILLDIIFKEFK